MAKYRKYINLGIVSLVLGSLLLISFFVLFAFFFVELFLSGNFSVLLLVLGIVSVLLSALFLAGGLFLVIFFAIRGKRLDKRNKQVVDVKSTEK